MEKKKIVIISGKQFSGKDTVANTLKNILEDFKIAPLADAIKTEFGEEKNITFNEIERNKPLYRAELIELGNKKRSKNKNYWINKVLSTSDNIIVSDVRLRHELETFKKLDAIAIRAESDRDERIKRGRLVSEDDSTETDLDKTKDWDYIIENNGTVEELQKKALKIAKQIAKEFSKIKV
jgi:phosphomevalonate kinase